MWQTDMKEDHSSYLQRNVELLPIRHHDVDERYGAGADPGFDQRRVLSYTISMTSQTISNDVINIPGEEMG